MSASQQARATFFTGFPATLFKLFAPAIHAALDGRVAGYVSDSFFRDGEHLTFGGAPVPTLTHSEFARIAQTRAVEVVHFFQNQDAMWCIPGLAGLGDVRVIDFLQKLDELGLPHTYQTVRDERLWWQQQSQERIGAVAGMLTDPRSRQTLRARVNAICKGDRTPLMATAFPGETEYFNPHKHQASLVPGPDEIYVDVGAAHGDTLEKFLKVTDGRFRHIHAFEPTPGQYRQLQRHASREGVTTHCKAVGAASGSITFYDNPENPFGANAVAATGTPITVPCVRLDDAVPECSLIKMDVEGYECKVIEGARELIGRCRPNMAITCYHYPQDLFEIVEKVRAIHSYRNIALRHYGPSLYDTVLLFSDRQRFDGAQSA